MLVSEIIPIGYLEEVDKAKSAAELLVKFMDMYPGVITKENETDICARFNKVVFHKLATMQESMMPHSTSGGGCYNQKL